MAVSRLIPAGGANDFNLAISGTYTSVTFNKEYASGSYSIISNAGDATFDIYAYNADGSLAAYTKTGSFTASKGFNKMVVLGGTSGDVLSFSYKTTFVTVDDSDEVTAGPVATSLTPSSLPNIDDTFTLTGRNFASDCTVTFTSANTAYAATQAKNIVRSSATSLIVTRPDNLVTDYSPYTITVSNPGVTNPTGSNSHILSNAITAGTNPVWSTSTPLPAFSKDVAYSQTLLATDTEGSDIDYSIVSGSLPAGLSLNGETGVISGTPTGTTPASFTVRATDAGGNFLDRAFTMPNAAPVWTTAAGALTSATSGSAYSVTITATDDSGVAPSYSIVSGSLPTGLSLNSSTGVISGTPTVGSNGTASSFTARATDANGVYTDRAFSIYVFSLINTRYTSSGSWTVPTGVTTASFVLVSGGGGGGYYPGSNVGSGGGGAGGVLHYQNQTVTPGSVFNFSIGAGATEGSTDSADNNAGGVTTCTGFTAPTGGGGGAGSGTGGSGGSGGGARSGSGGTGVSGQGSNGGNSSDQDGGGGGGGRNAAGGNTSGVQAAAAGNGGSGITLYGFTVAGGGGGGHSDRAGYPAGGGAGTGGAGGGGNGGSTITGSGRGSDGAAGTGGGGGGSGSASGGGTGGSGCVIISYLGQENNGTFRTNR